MANTTNAPSLNPQHTSKTDATSTPTRTESLAPRAQANPALAAFLLSLIDRKSLLGGSSDASAVPDDVKEKFPELRAFKSLGELRAAAKGCKKAARRGATATDVIVPAGNGALRPPSARQADATDEVTSAPSTSSVIGVDPVLADAALAQAPPLVLAAKESGARAAVVLDFIRHYGLHERLGYSSIEKYAIEKLNLSGRSSYDFYAGCGGNVRTHCPALYRAILDGIKAGPELTQDGASPAVPEMTVFSLIPKLLKVLPTDEGARTLKRIEAGELTTRDVKALIRKGVAPSRAEGHGTLPHSTSTSSPPTDASTPSQRELPALAVEARRALLVRAVADLEAVLDIISVTASNLSRVPRAPLTEDEQRLRDNAIALLDAVPSTTGTLRAAISVLESPKGGES